jgi:hypothetical protein
MNDELHGKWEIGNGMLVQDFDTVERARVYERAHFTARCAGTRRFPVSGYFFGSSTIS